MEQSLTAAIISKIKSSYQFRREEVCNLFKEELFQRAHSISEDENTLYHGTKSDILKRLNSTEKSNLNPENLEAVVQRCSVKKVFLEISQNSQENICARVSFLVKLTASENRNAIIFDLSANVKSKSK